MCLSPEFGLNLLGIRFCVTVEDVLPCLIGWERWASRMILGNCSGAVPCEFPEGLHFVCHDWRKGGFSRGRLILPPQESTVPFRLNTPNYNDSHFSGHKGLSLTFQHTSRVTVTLVSVTVAFLWRVGDRSTLRGREVCVHDKRCR